MALNKIVYFVHCDYLYALAPECFAFAHLRSAQKRLSYTPLPTPYLLSEPNRHKRSQPNGTQVGADGV
jgi:hypothetical protein